MKQMKSLSSTGMKAWNTAKEVTVHKGSETLSCQKYLKMSGLVLYYHFTTSFAKKRVQILKQKKKKETPQNNQKPLVISQVQ